MHSRKIFYSFFFICFFTFQASGEFFIQNGVGIKSDVYKIFDRSLYSSNLFPNPDEVQLNGLDLNFGLGFSFETNSNFISSIILNYSIQTGEKNVSGKKFLGTPYVITVKDSYNFDLYAQFGGAVNEKVDIYSNVGISVASFTTRKTFVFWNNYSIYENYSIPVVLIGVGAQFAIDKKLLIFFEGNLRYGQIEKNNITVKINNVGVLLGLRYHIS